jgi:hypothetical protein
VVRVPGYRSTVPGFDSRHYQIFWEVVGLERGPFSLVSTIEKPLGRNSWGSGLESWGDLLRWPRDTFHPQRMALSEQTSGGRSVDIRVVRSRTQATFMKMVVRASDLIPHTPTIRFAFDMQRIRQSALMGNQQGCESSSIEQVTVNLVLQTAGVLRVGRKCKLLYRTQHYGNPSKQFT